MRLNDNGEAFSEKNISFPWIALQLNFPMMVNTWCHNWYSHININCALFIISVGAMIGCSAKPVDTFKLQTAMPANFELQALASYAPASGETCTVKRGTPTRFPFKSELQEAAHTVEFDIPLAKIADSCSLVLKSIKLDIKGRYGPRWTNIGIDSAWLTILDRETGTPPLLGKSGQLFNGQCQWLFRTMGPNRYLAKILKCRAEDKKGEVLPRLAGGILKRGQLAGETVNIAFRIVEEELPYMGDTWVKFANGWKRCMGKGLDDAYAFCRGNNTDFKSFRMPDGRDCSIYPSCTE
ncbi:hypothetical protein QN382_20155 [Pseudomonas sp. 10B1]|uniref:hypothetical protein n=1 Tax=unclassified Pseudomonas TaxID=196821 RepID=UPI002AB4F36C|nr:MULTISPECIES: hypothetical protein [unclassified Pseudomonas]MDY7562611.1 hypothetical protein [Pseudomonas sp. AB6]MEA9979988.1 hypothetical protein [Pseudomonas sp. RTS4]MEA9997295.1 hypothetical protein [Pseudomonas sp. AA4]MEB0087419.1 hypothetical protein [Pseudomonas sp. RTI1]MEB0128481.1 hypothetical protein [Pseudomonas sp. CCC1.2]